MPGPSRPGASSRRDPDATRVRDLHRRVHPFRTLGVGLAALPVGLAMHENGAGWLSWAWMAAACFAWPQLAYLIACRSRDPFAAESRNLMLDSAIAGSLVPLMQFNVLPSVVLVTVATADKFNSGVRGLWGRALAGTVVAILLFGALTGFAMRPATSMPVLLACLPVMIIHTMAVSLSSYRLVRQVQMQNRQLEALSQRDALTGLQSRGYWEQQAGALLGACQAGSAPATLLLLDTDEFKQINDRYGHGMGDDVLRAIADVLRARLPDGGHAGRLGGDEFVVVLPLPPVEAACVAETMRAGVEALRFPDSSELRASVSIGLAEAPGGDLDLREWLEAADRALYRAKHAGRNRVAVVA